jgi:tripartite-type tricarboxylate transporter receptor subunit TctC
MPKRLRIGRPVTTAGLVVAAAAAVIASASPTAAQDYYAGKTIDLIVGNYPGGGFDIYARAVARHLGRHIPGNPTVVVKNMPGAGSAKAGVHISQIAPKDGLSIGAVTPGAITGPLLSDKPQSLFDPSKVIYLGTANSGTRVCVTFEKSKIRSFKQAMTEKTVLGAVAPGDAVHDFAYMIRATTGASINVVPGYKGTLDVTLAMERGEIDGACGWEWSSAKSQRAEWIRDGRLNFLLQIGPHAHDELTKMGVPPLWQYVKDDDSRHVAELIVSQQAFQRPYFVAPGTPAAYVAILRKAFDDTMRDRQFLADAEKLRIEVSSLSGATVQELVQKFYATPKSVVERARRAVRP